MSEAVCTTVTDTCAYILTDLPHLMGEAQIDSQMHGGQAMDIPHPDIRIPTILLQTRAGNLTGTDSLTEIPPT